MATPLPLSVTENADVSGLMLMSGSEYSSSDTDGSWISDKYAAANNISVGDKITFIYKNINIETTVKGLIKSSEYLVCVRDSSQLMPDFDTFGFAYISPCTLRKGDRQCFLSADKCNIRHGQKGIYRKSRQSTR